MHEISLATSLVELVEAKAKEEAFNQVLEIEVEIGQLSGVNAEAFEFAFTEVIKNSVLEGAKLLLHKISIQILCPNCHQTSTIQDAWDLSCPQCLAQGLSPDQGVKVLRGREFRIRNLTVL